MKAILEYYAIIEYLVRTILSDEIVRFIRGFIVTNRWFLSLYLCVMVAGGLLSWCYHLFILYLNGRKFRTFAYEPYMLCEKSEVFIEFSFPEHLFFLFLFNSKWVRKALGVGLDIIISYILLYIIIVNFVVFHLF